jgi:hypothetical protein
LLPGSGGKSVLGGKRCCLDLEFGSGKNLCNLDLVANVCFLYLVDKVCYLHLVQWQKVRYQDLVALGFGSSKNLCNLDLVTNVCFLDLVDKVCYLRLVAKVPHLDLVALGFVGGKNVCTLKLMAKVCYLHLVPKFVSWIWRQKFDTCIWWQTSPYSLLFFLKEQLHRISDMFTLSTSRKIQLLSLFYVIL